MKILLVDDHKLIRQSLANVISTDKDNVVIGEAGNGKEAIQKFIDLEPDLIVMDINMPEMDGVDAAHKIRKIDKNVKILILTMMENEQYIIDALSANVNGYIFKMSDIDNLLYALDSIKGGEDYFEPRITKFLVSNYKEKKDYNNILSDRELQVLRSIVDGFKTKEIAEQLFISFHTVQKHRKNILQKINVKGTAELVKFAIEKKIV